MDFTRLIDNPEYKDLLGTLEQDRGLQPGLLSGIMMNETGGGHKNIINKSSTAGAQGAFQFMPGTAKQYKVNVADHGDSARGASDYLENLSKRYNGDPLLAAAAYNWGEGNLDKAIKRAGTNDIVALSKGGFLPKETDNYVRKLDKFLSVGQAQAAPAEPRGPVVQPRGPAPAIDPAIQEAQNKIDQQSFFTNLGQGVSDKLDDAGLAMRKTNAALFGVGTERAEKDNQAQIARNASPEYQAKANTWGHVIGGGATEAVPYLAGGVAGGIGKTLLGTALRQGAAASAVGGAQGFTNDADTLGQRVANAGKQAALEGAVGAGAVGAGAVLGAGARRLIQGNKTTRDMAGEALSRQLDLGMTPSATSISGRYADVLRTGSGQKVIDQAENFMSSKMAKAVDIPDWSEGLTPELVAAAKPKIEAGLNVVRQVPDFVPSSNFVSSLDDALNKGVLGAKKTSGLKSQLTPLLNQIKSGGSVNGKILSEIRDGLQDVITKGRYGLEDREVAKTVIGQIDDVLKNNLPKEMKTVFDDAMTKKRSLDAIEEIMLKKGTSEKITPTMMQNALKSKFKEDFAKGAAPFQKEVEEFGRLFQKAKPVEKSLIASLLSRSTPIAYGAGVIANPLAAAGVFLGKEGGALLRRKLATSNNPTIIKLLTGASDARLGKGVKVPSGAAGGAAPDVKVQNQSMPAGNAEKMKAGLVQSLQKDAKSTITEPVAAPSYLKNKPNEKQGVVPSDTSNVDLKVQNQTTKYDDAEIDKLLAEYRARKANLVELKPVEKWAANQNSPGQQGFKIRKDGKDIGRVDVWNNDPGSLNEFGKTGYSLKGITLDKEFQKQGLSKDIIRQLTNKYGTLVSDTRNNISEAGHKMFAKYGEKQPDGTYLLRPNKTVAQKQQLPVSREAKEWDKFLKGDNGVIEGAEKKEFWDSIRALDEGKSVKPLKDVDPSGPWKKVKGFGNAEREMDNAEYLEFARKSNAEQAVKRDEKLLDVGRKLKSKEQMAKEDAEYLAFARKSNAEQEIKRDALLNPQAKKYTDDVVVQKQQMSRAPGLAEKITKMMKNMGLDKFDYEIAADKQYVKKAFKEAFGREPNQEELLKHLKMRARLRKTLVEQDMKKEQVADDLMTSMYGVPKNDADRKRIMKEILIENLKSANTTINDIPLDEIETRVMTSNK